MSCRSNDGAQTFPRTFPQGQKNRGTRPRFSGISEANSIPYVRKAHEKRHAKCVPFASLRDAAHAERAQSPAVFRQSRNRQDRRAAAARPPLPCRGEGGIASGFSGTGGVSKGDSVPLRRRKTARRRFLRVLRVLAGLAAGVEQLSGARIVCQLEHCRTHQEITKILLHFSLPLSFGEALFRVPSAHFLFW